MLDHLSYHKIRVNVFFLLFDTNLSPSRFSGRKFKGVASQKKTKLNKKKQVKTKKRTDCRHCRTFNQLPAVRQGNPSGTVMPPLRIYLSYSQFSPSLSLYFADKFPVSRFFILDILTRAERFD